MSETIHVEKGGIATLPFRPLDRATAVSIVSDGIQRYIAERRALIPGFVHRNFGGRGAARLHRAAFGFDLLRAPANIAMGFAALGKSAAAAGLKLARRERAAASLRARNLFLETDVGRE